MISRLHSISTAVAMIVGLAGAAPAQNKTDSSKGQSSAKSDEPAKKSEATRSEDTAKRKDATNPKDGTKSKGPAKPKYEKATFGAGCFWHVEAEFERLPGVQSAVSGYSGGDPRFRSYDMVHEGWTGHAEVVQVVYDPEVVTYRDLLKVFWSIHDPTTLNRQGPDEGTQYRSIIFYHNKEQRQAAFESYQYLTASGAFRDPIVTQLQPMQAFFPAEPEHQDFYGGKPRASSRRSKAAVAKMKKTQARVKNTISAPKANDAETTDSAGKPSE